MNKKLTITLLASLFLTGIAALASAQIITLPNPLCSGGSVCINSFPDLVDAIASWIRNIVGSLAVIMFLWAGILFLTSAGNESRLASARRALWWAVIGTAVALVGQSLVLVIRTIVG